MGNDYENNEFFRTTDVTDFVLKNVGETPKGYPTNKIIDEYSKVVNSASYEQRKQIFKQHVINTTSFYEGILVIKSIFYELIRINENKAPIHEGILVSALNYIDARLDCADFVLSGFIRYYYQLLHSDLVSNSTKEKVKETILNFKYWADEPGVDSMCYWTENHYMLFSSNELLAGQLFRDEIFTNSGMTGKEKIKKATIRVEKWLKLRYYTGFNEWLSNVYYDENFTSLLNLYDFCENENIRDKSKIIIDLLAYDMACNSYYGLFSCTHGRTYTKQKVTPYKESTIDTAKILFGIGRFAYEDNMSAVMFALSKYEIPHIIFKIATSNNEEWINKQRVSIKFEEAKKWGLHKKDTETAIDLLSFGGYCHHRTINHMVNMLDEFNWWENKFFQEFSPFKKAMQVGSKIKLTNFVAYTQRKDMSRNCFTESNIYTYKTQDYMLSTAQQFRPGYGGDQHHIWQATLDDEAVCFTTHPGGYGESAPDAYWHGNGFLPKSVQNKNIGISIYNTPKVMKLVIKEILQFTHAFFPKDRFDEVVEKNNWIIGKKNSGYIALHSMNNYYWAENNEAKDKGSNHMYASHQKGQKQKISNSDIVADGKQNIWIVEMGTEKEYKTFQNFVQSILNSKITFNGLNVTYESKSQGTIEYGWNNPLKINGEVVKVDDYKRYDNKTCQAEYGSDTIKIQYDNEVLEYNFD